MNDDWDGVDWAMHFSGPDDNEIERLQEASYQENVADENDSEDVYDPYAAEYENLLSEAVNSPENPTSLAYKFWLNNIEKTNIFINYARKLGAKDIKVTRHEHHDLLNSEATRDDESAKDLKHFAVSLHAPGGTNFTFYRAGLRYQDSEKKEIVESYLRWTDVDQIAHRHKRTPTAISALLRDGGFVFYPKVYRDPDCDDGDEKDYASNTAGFYACEALAAGLEHGLCTQHLKSYLSLNSAVTGHSPIYINDLPEADKRKIIAFAARSISLDSAKSLARKLNQWSLLYFLALQSNDVLCGLDALDRKAANLSANLEFLRYEIKCYVRSRAVEILRAPLLKWIQHADIRYNPSHSAHAAFLEATLEFKKLYEASSPTKGFEDQGYEKLLIALLACNFESLTSMAKKGDQLAKWYCCDWAVTSIKAGGDFRCDSDWARETDSLNIDHAELLRGLHASLPFDPSLASLFSKRIKSQFKMDAAPEKP